jgi:hypothetical protein
MPNHEHSKVINAIHHETDTCVCRYERACKRISLALEQQIVQNTSLEGFPGFLGYRANATRPDEESQFKMTLALLVQRGVGL